MSSSGLSNQISMCRTEGFAVRRNWHNEFIKRESMDAVSEAFNGVGENKTRISTLQDAFSEAWPTSEETQTDQPLIERVTRNRRFRFRWLAVFLEGLSFMQEYSIDHVLAHNRVHIGCRRSRSLLDNRRRLTWDRYSNSLSVRSLEEIYVYCNECPYPQEIVRRTKAPSKETRVGMRAMITSRDACSAIKPDSDIQARHRMIQTIC